MNPGLTHVVVVLAICSWPLTLCAQESSPWKRENQELRSRIDRLESLVDELQSDHPGSTQPAFGATPIPTLEEMSPDQPIEHASFSTWKLNTALSSSVTTYPDVNLTGFFQADTGWVSQSDFNQMAVGDALDGADFRRARLAAIGHVADNVGYILEMDFAFPGRPSFMDVWGEIRDLHTLQNIRFGQYRQPFGLDGLTSVKELTFLERGLPFAFLPFRQTGVMAHGVSESEDMTWAFSGFRAPVDTFAGNVGDNGGYGLATRLTAVIADDTQGGIAHIGGAYSVIDPTDDLVQYRNQPEFFLSDSVTGETPFFVDTGPIATEIVNLFAGEFAATSDNWHAQGELIYAVVNRDAFGSAMFSGASIQAGYILTGEHRPYNRKEGILGRIVPHENFGSDGGCGAWEVAARWSYLDLNDNGIDGGQLTDLTTGLNWYLNRNTKFQINYVHAFVKTPGLGDSDADIIAMRAQVDF